MNGSTIDYYAVLGVSPNATLPAIKNAYRSKAMSSHPDRHPRSEAHHWHSVMLQVNAAYEILSNPEARSRYDAARSQGKAPTSDPAFRAKAEQAQEHAAQYPKDGKEFESWLDSVCNDFNAEMESIQFGGFPLVTNSVSGFLLVTGGVVVGLVVWSVNHSQNSGTGVFNSPLSYGAIGALIGMVIRAIGANLLNGSPSKNPEASHPDEMESRPTKVAHHEAHRPQSNSEQNPSNYQKPVDWTVTVIVSVVAFLVLCGMCTVTVGGGFFGPQETSINWPGVLIGTTVCGVLVFNFSNKKS